MASPHLLLYTDDASAGGVAQYNHAILLAAVAAGYRVTRATHRHDDPLSRLQAAAGIAQVTIPPYPNPIVSAAAHDDFRALCRAHAPDLLLFSDSCPVVHLAAKEVARELAIPFVIVEGFVAPYLAQKFPALVRRLDAVYRHARAVIAVSHENLSLLHRLFRLPAGAGSVIHYGRPAPFFAPRNEAVRLRLRAASAIPENAVVALTSARLDEIKGHALQIQAMRRLKDTPAWNRLHFVWAGAGDFEFALRRELGAHALADHVTFLGQRWDIPDLLDMADLFLLPTHFEGMPLAIMEAMAKGLPVVASAVSGIPEELGDTGYLLPDPNLDPGQTVGAMASILTRLASDPEARRRAGAAARERAARHFREELMVERTLRLLAAARAPQPQPAAPAALLPTAPPVPTLIPIPADRMLVSSAPGAVARLLEAARALLPGDSARAADTFLQAASLDGVGTLAHRELSLLHTRENRQHQALNHYAFAEIFCFGATPPEEFTRLAEAVRPCTDLTPLQLFSLYTHARQLCVDDLPGDAVLCSAGAGGGGGAAALIAAVFQAHTARPRRVHVFDTFEGAPSPLQGAPGAGPADAHLEQLLDTLARQLGVESLILPHKGPFSDTFAAASIPAIALLHIAAGAAPATADILRAWLPALAPGSPVQLDGWGVDPACRAALDACERSLAALLPLRTIDDSAVWFRTPNPRFAAADYIGVVWAAVAEAHAAHDRPALERAALSLLRIAPGHLRAQAILASARLPQDAPTPVPATPSPPQP